MPTKKNEKPIEAEVVEEKIRVESSQGHVRKRPHGGFVFGLILLVLGVFLILENYLQISLMQYFWPILLLLLGGLLIYRSFNG
jgi:uncharacterized membrane protein HdeD (DUF308 family)